MKNPKLRAVLYGIIAILVVITLNLTVLSILDFPQMAKDIIKRYIALFILLIGGFGFQVGLFTYFRHISKLSCSTAVASGGISTISMILCCSHYIVNFLPFLGALIGISALSILSEYTPYLLGFGILSNAIGISIILYQSKKGMKVKK